MAKELKGADVLALGFMTFAFFLGAGNMIFPPLAGLQSAGDLSSSIVGFLMTAVGLPLLTIIAVALAGGGLETLSKVLPKGLSLALCIAIYLILGPFFATPRTGLVAYKLGFSPFISNPDWLTQALYSLGFFALTFYLAIRPGKLLSVVGKVITPVLLVLLAAIAVMLVFHPLGEMGSSNAAWHKAPFAKGFLEGYMTMDTLGALLFGLVIVNALKSRGVEDRKAQFRYLCMAGAMAAIGLALVYITLFFLGATSGHLVANPKDGADVLVPAIEALFGPAGLYLLATVVTLACLTTAVGLTSSCAEYFNAALGLNLKLVAAVVATGSALVANVGLSQLIAISVPVLFFVYPVAIALVALRLLAGVVGHKRWGQQLVVGITAFFALFDGLKAAGLPVPEQWLSHLPFFEDGLGWLVPTAAALVVMSMFRRAEAVRSEVLN
ncbi:branched-chain amino acid transport system II carrier protein [Gallaecimonas pentaromativorans]|uniref:branched-chain amino acid transport system II carrier protein n=1 Tax=Gallaecimonas pentaromativorans TaxID=584787 RepID=UPI0009F912BD|nr:branched-chain amino acid transport system II carrier protein [Gallaecimonas pentaromativorans]MED5523184.1 branched-chain amino acid transport system II carrier protein [Pseudomonadota bacterium]